MTIKIFCLGMMALLLGADVALAGSLPLGTVFYSPEERRQLVDRRNGIVDEVVVVPETKVVEEAPLAVEAEAKPPASRPMTVSGIVSRSGGRSVVWLNGQPVAESPADPSLPALRLSTDQASIDGKAVKVGETIDLVSGDRSSPLPDGAIKVRP